MLLLPFLARLKKLPGEFDNKGKEIIGMAGGVSIVVNNQVIGGIGASGLSEEEDEQLVQAALARCYS